MFFAKASIDIGPQTGPPPHKLVCEPDGKLVLYDATGMGQWYTDANRKAAPDSRYRVVLDDNGDLVLFNSRMHKVWQAKIPAQQSREDRGLQLTDWIRRGLELLVQERWLDAIAFLLHSLKAAPLHIFSKLADNVRCV